MRQGVGDVGDQRAGLGVDLAALQAEAAVDAVRAVPEPAVGDRDRADPGRDAGGGRAAEEDLAVAGHRVRVVRVAVRVTPGPVLPGDRQFGLELLVVRLEVGVADGPVGADPVGGEGVEVGRVEAGGVPGVVDHGAADAAAGVVGPQRDRVVAADLPGLGPVQGVRAAFVADPVGVRVPERPGVQADDAPPGAGQPLGEDAAAGAGAHDHQVHLVGVGVAAHVGAQPVVGAGPVVGQQPGRFVPGPDVPVEAHGSDPRSSRSSPGGPVRSACACRARSTRAAKGTGSASTRSRVSHRSRALIAGVQVAAGVGRAGEPDLVPRPGVGVERGAGVPGPQAPHLGRRVVVPRLAAVREVLHGLDQRRLLARPQPGERPAVPMLRRPGRGSRGCPATPARPRAGRRSASRRFRRSPGGCRSGRAPAPAARCPGRAAGPAAVRRPPARPG